MHHSVHPKGICARQIDFDLEDGVVKNMKFTGGCDGNHKGLSALVEGMPAQEVVKRLSGVTCGFRPTSCPDQLAVAILQVLEQQG